MDISIEQIINKIQKLETDYKAIDKSTPCLKEQTNYRYERRILTQIAKIFKKHNTGSSISRACLLDLSRVIKESWTLFIGYAPSHTVLPESKVTELVCSITRLIACEMNKENPAQPVSALGLLMSTLSLESIDDSYPDLLPYKNNITGEWEELDLINILNTHILGDDGLYLIPVALLSDKKRYVPEKHTFENPYYNYTKHEAKHIYLSEKEYQRLVNHSLITRELNELRKKYENLCMGEHLLGRLNQLCHQLRFNSVLGVGTEYNAGDGVYDAIIDFTKYYKSIKSQKNKIPPELVKELKFLQELSTDPTKNKNASENVETCVATRREAIEKAMQGHEPLLASITLEGKDQRQFVKQVQNDLNHSENYLKSLIDNKKYKGADRLPYSLEIMQVLGIKLNFSSLENLEELKTFTLEEMEIILNDPRLLYQIMTCLEQIDNLFLFVSELPIDHCGLFFNHLSEYTNFWESRFSSWGVNGLSRILNTFDVERCKVIASSMKPFFLNQHNSYYVQQMFNYLTLEYRTLLYPIYKEELLNSISLPSHFNTLLFYFDEAIRKDIYKNCKYKIKSLLYSSKNFAQNLKQILHPLNPEQRAEIFNPYKNNLSLLINSGVDFGDILYYLNQKQRDEMYEKYKEQLGFWIHNIIDLCTMLKNFNDLQRKEVCSNHQPKLLKLLLEDPYFELIINEISSTVRQTIYSVYKNNFSQISNNIDALKKLILPLKGNEFKEILKLCSSFFPKLISSVHDFQIFLERLSFEQKQGVFSAFQNQLPHLVHSAKDFSICCKTLAFIPDQFEIFYKQWKFKLPSLIHSAEDLRLVLKYLTESQRKELYGILKKLIPNLIHNASDFAVTLEYLYPSHRNEVYLMYKDRLVNFIHSGEELATLFSYSTFKQQLELIKPMSAQEIKDYFQHENVQKKFFFHLQALPNLFRSISELSTEQFKAILEFLFADSTFKQELIDRALIQPFIDDTLRIPNQSYQTFYQLCAESLNATKLQELNSLIIYALVNSLHEEIRALNINSPRLISYLDWIEEIKYFKAEFDLDCNWELFQARCEVLNMKSLDLKPVSQSIFDFFFTSVEFSYERKAIQDIQKILKKISDTNLIFKKSFDPKSNYSYNYAYENYSCGSM